MKLPRMRMKPGQGFLGPDFYNCCNTGTAPLIMRSKFLPGQYLVGPELYVERVLINAALNPRKRIWHVDGKTVYAYRTRASAVNRFSQLCQEATVRNERMAREHRAALEGAARLDMDCVNQLMDF